MANFITRNIPNTITCCNLVSGCIATYNAFLGNAKMALLWIVVGAVFDFFDGMSARLLHVSSPIGKELDSLADDVTFGVAPSTIIFSELQLILNDDWTRYLAFLAYVMAAFSALRLAKFNLDERQALGFIGMPTPANALFWSSLVIGLQEHFGVLPTWTAGVILLMVFVCSWLLVSEIPMFALKFKQWGWKGNEVKYIFVISCIPLLLCFKVLGIAVIIAWYVLLSILTQKK